MWPQKSLVDSGLVFLTKHGLSDYNRGNITGQPGTDITDSPVCWLIHCDCLDLKLHSSLCMECSRIIAGREWKDGRDWLCSLFHSHDKPFIYEIFNRYLKNTERDEIEWATREMVYCWVLLLCLFIEALYGRGYCLSFFSVLVVLYYVVVNAVWKFLLRLAMFKVLTKRVGLSFRGIVCRYSWL